MRKLIVVLSFLPLAGIAQKKEDSFKIIGSLKNAPADLEWIFISYSTGGERVTDSAKLIKGKYRFSGKIAEPVLASLRVKYAIQDDGKMKALNYKRDVATVFLEKGKIKVTSSDSLGKVNVNGSSAHNEFVKLNNALKPFTSKMDALYARYSEYRNNKDEVNLKKTETEIDALDTEIKNAVYAQYVKANPSAPLALYAVKQFAGWDINPDKVEPLFNSLTPSVQQWPSAINLKEKIEIAKKTGIGRDAMDFTQNDTSGLPVSLSSFRGKYILVDFWASWCGPCRVENPYVVKAFHKYKDKGFHILGVSLDRPGHKEKWMKAIYDDKLDWTHVSDLKYWQNEVAVMYGINAIPQNLLINPDGKIIAKNLRGDELDKRLEEFIVEGKKAF